MQCNVYQNLYRLQGERGTVFINLGTYSVIRYLDCHLVIICMIFRAGGVGYFHYILFAHDILKITQNIFA